MDQREIKEKTNGRRIVPRVGIKIITVTGTAVTETEIMVINTNLITITEIIITSVTIILIITIMETITREITIETSTETTEVTVIRVEEIFHNDPKMGMVAIIGISRIIVTIRGLT